MTSFDFLFHDRQHHLLFSSGTFLAVFGGFVAVWALLRGQRARLGLLLAFSYYYFYRCNGTLMLVLVALTVADWAIALQLGRTQTKQWRKTWLTGGILLNLGALAFFKYTNFFLANASVLTQTRLQPLEIFLPIGISFHVFQSISYLVDVHRRSFPPTRSLFEYALFLSFFPQVVAGPIVRASEFFPQIRLELRPTSEDVSAGLYRIVIGIFKKALLADYIGMYVDLVFGSPSAYSGPELLLGIYGYAAQIYLDFSGYTDIAIGLAAILGIRMPENFDAPYAATSMTQFWRSWHQSLSRWLRDYVYIPLGGNRHGSLRRYSNLMLTMLLGGLWHGASWTFVVWGGVHGAVLAIESGIRRKGGDGTGGGSRTRSIVGWFLTFHLVSGLWVLFRARDHERAWLIYRGVVEGWEPGRLIAIANARPWLFAAVAMGLIAAMLPRGTRSRGDYAFRRAPWPLQAAILAIVLLLVAEGADSEIQPFIYFQF